MPTHASVPQSRPLQVLLVEDDGAARRTLAESLRAEQCVVFEAADGVVGLEIAAREPLDIVVLDLMLPRLGGEQMLARLRRGNDVPVIVVSAKHSEDDRVTVLDLGADDYLVKPFASKELSARVRALLRRTSTTANDTRLVAGPLTIDRDTRNVARAGRNIELTKTEFNLLELLAEQCDIVVSRDFIYEHVWGYNFETSSKSLDVYVGYLRRKINAPGESDLIRTVRGVGYSLVTK